MHSWLLTSEKTIPTCAAISSTFGIPAAASFSIELPLDAGIELSRKLA